MLIKDQLEQTQAGFAVRVPSEAQTEILRHVRDLQQSDTEFGLKVGAPAPDFTLTDPLGNPVSLHNELAQGPVVLIFYRGGWCPFCNIQLRGFQQLLPEMMRHGGRLIAVSPQSPDNSLSQKEKEELTFPVLSDPDGLVAERYRLLFELPDSLQHTYRHTLKLDLAAYNNTNRWILPVPATYLIGRDGIIRLAEINPDFMKRMEPQFVLDELKKL